MRLHALFGESVLLSYLLGGTAVTSNLRGFTLQRLAAIEPARPSPQSEGPGPQMIRAVCTCSIVIVHYIYFLSLALDFISTYIY